MSNRDPLNAYNSFAYDNGTSPFNNRSNRDTQHIHLHGGSLLSIKSHPYGPWTSPGVWTPPPDKFIRGRGLASSLVKTLGSKILGAAAAGAVKLGTHIFKKAKKKAKKRGKTILKTTAKSATKKVDALATRAINKVGSKVNNLSSRTLNKVDKLIPTDTTSKLTNKRKLPTTASIKHRQSALDRTLATPTGPTKRRKRVIGPT